MPYLLALTLVLFAIVGVSELGIEGASVDAQDQSLPAHPDPSPSSGVVAETSGAASTRSDVRWAGLGAPAGMGGTGIGIPGLPAATILWPDHGKSAPAASPPGSLHEEAEHVDSEAKPGAADGIPTPTVADGEEIPARWPGDVAGGMMIAPEMARMGATVPSGRAMMEEPRPGEGSGVVPAALTTRGAVAIDLPPSGGSREATATPSPEVRRAQRLLSHLGYRPGPADGLMGPRTEAAIRSFQSRQGLKATGEVTPALLERLEGAVQRQTRARRNGTVAASAPSSGWEGTMTQALGGVAGTVQRLLGYDFNSRTRPYAIHAYCRDHPDTWIYDEGEQKFLLCRRAVPEQTSRRR